MLASSPDCNRGSRWGRRFRRHSGARSDPRRGARAHVAVRHELICATPILVFLCTTVGCCGSLEVGGCGSCLSGAWRLGGSEHGYPFVRRNHPGSTVLGGAKPSVGGARSRASAVVREAGRRRSCGGPRGAGRARGRASFVRPDHPGGTALGGRARPSVGGRARGRVSSVAREAQRRPEPWSWPMPEVDGVRPACPLIRACSTLDGPASAPRSARGFMQVRR